VEISVTEGAYARSLIVRQKSNSIVAFDWGRRGESVLVSGENGAVLSSAGSKYPPRIEGTVVGLRTQYGSVKRVPYRD